MGKDTTEGNGGADQGIKLFVTTDGELQVAGSDTLDFEILGGILRGGEKSRVSIRLLLGSNHRQQ